MHAQISFNTAVQYGVCRSMDSYLTLPITENKLQELTIEAKDFMYALGKEIEIKCCLKEP